MNPLVPLSPSPFSKKTAVETFFFQQVPAILLFSAIIKTDIFIKVYW